MRIVRPEQLDSQLRELMQLAAERGEEAARVAVDESNAEKVYLENKPDVAPWIEESLKRALLDEIVVAEEPAAEVAVGQDFIQHSERELEIAKRALVQLRIPQLKRLATSLGIVSSGTQAELVDKIAREYQDDPEEIARLVLAYAEARPERGLVDRLYRVDEAIDDLYAAQKTLEGLSGRYIRVGIARWFVFSSARAGSDGLWLEGIYRSYNADAKREGDEFELVAVPSDAKVGLRLRADQRHVEVRGRGVAESKAILTALRWATQLSTAERLDLDVQVPEGELMGWDHRSVFLFHFLDRVLPDSGIDILNLTTAKFEASAPVSGYTRQPSVRSVAIHGQHLLSSKAACELLVEGRALVEVSAEVRFRPGNDAVFFLPLRFSVSDDHASVLTGFGQHSPETAATLHRNVVARLRRALNRSVVVDEELQALARRVSTRARSSEPVDEADIFPPPADWGRSDVREGDAPEVVEAPAEVPAEELGELT